MEPRVTPLDDDHGLSLYDPIETARFFLYTDRPVDPRPADPGEFAFPVETAVSVRAGELIVPKRAQIRIQRFDGEFIDSFQAAVSDRRTDDRGRLLDVTGTPMKLYLVVPGPFELVADGRTTVISLPEPRELVVGVRSFHERPVGTIETPPDPEPVMRALSAAGSALKTLTCERSYPTLRGHPPAFEPADELSIPESIEPPDTAVTVRVPPEWEYVYPVAPLAYYLGATVRPGDPARLEVDDRSFRLTASGRDPRAVESRINRTLQQVFFLDCLTRTEGIYPVDLHERRMIPADLDLDFGELYGAPIATQVRTYLEVPYEAIEALLPRWHLCVDVQPTAEHVTALPYLLDDLSLIRNPRLRDPAVTAPAVQTALDAFVRSEPHRDDLHANGSAEVFSLPPAPAMEHAYLGEGLPLRRNKLSATALQRRMEYDEASDESIGVTVVCNDERMTAESAVEEFYGVHAFVRHSVDVEYDLTRTELADVLQDDVDLLHYVGHIDEDGFVCVDGDFDARTLDDVGVDTFLLNACNSYQQGRALLDGGARAGVTSLTVVNNEEADRLGRTMARALNAGFTLRSALLLTSFDSRPDHYVVVGDGGRRLVQCKSNTLMTIDVVDADLVAGEVTYDLFTFPTKGGQGALFSRWESTRVDRYLMSGPIDRFTEPIDEFVEYLGTQPFPVVADGTLHWSNELDRQAVTEMLSEIETLQEQGDGPTKAGEYLRPLRTGQ